MFLEVEEAFEDYIQHSRVFSDKEEEEGVLSEDGVHRQLRYEYVLVILGDCANVNSIN